MVTNSAFSRKSPRWVIRIDAIHRRSNSSPPFLRWRSFSPPFPISSTAHPLLVNDPARALPRSTPSFLAELHSLTHMLLNPSYSGILSTTNTLSVCCSYLHIVLNPMINALFSTARRYFLYSILKAPPIHVHPSVVSVHSATLELQVDSFFYVSAPCTILRQVFRHTHCFRLIVFRVRNTSPFPQQTANTHNDFRLFSRSVPETLQI